MSQHIVKSTERLASVVLVAAIFITIGSFPGNLIGIPPGYSRILVWSGVFLIILSLVLMGYVNISMNKITRSGVKGAADRGFEGDELWVSYRLCNRGLIPIGPIEIFLVYPEHLRLSKGSRRALIMIPPKGCVIYKAAFEARTGRHLIGPLRIVVRDPLGLFRSDEIDVGEPVELLVLPRLIPSSLRSSLLLSRSLGMARSRISGSGTEFLSVREYREGDEPRRIVWRHTARWGKLIVKETEKEASGNIFYILLIAGDMFTGPYRETPFENAARIIATMSRYSAARGDAMFLALYSRETIDLVGPSRGLGGYRSILSRMARISFSQDTVVSDIDPRPLAKLLMRNLKGGDIVLLFTAPSRDSSAIATAIERIERSVRNAGGSFYTVIPTPSLDLARRLDLGSKIKLMEMIKDSIALAKELRGRGVKAINISQGKIITLTRLIEMTS
ncbi:MAG: hypothetical protein DJ555_06855 [Desulfurococcaceae archaeon]|jgi:uncharacterized protein (DUF58 family)|nr:MAG: hypothetical protein DJ555_06855 [Desulfurococcaceae archaeon]